MGPGHYGSENEKNWEKEKMGTEIKSNPAVADESVDVHLPGVGKVCLRGTFGVTVAGIVILSIFLIERMYSLSLCLAEQNREERTARWRDR